MTCAGPCPSQGGAGRACQSFQVVFFLLCVSFRRPHGVAELHQPALRGDLPMDSFRREGWRLRLLVKGDGQKTHSRAEKKRP